MKDLMLEANFDDATDWDTNARVKPRVIPGWDGVLTASTVTGGELHILPIAARELILATWFCVGDLGFIFAPRGVGKTWWAMCIAIAISTGGKAGPWASPKPRRVLYVDGEMALDLTQQRYRALCLSPSDNLMFLHHEIVFGRTGQVLNLTSPQVQAALFQHVIKNNVEVLVLDNLSCLFSGVKENDADAWELILPWILRLRRHHIAVVIVAHAGRNGLMRGTSRREDAASWVVSLEEPSEAAATGSGARFVSYFKKCRNCPGEDAPGMEWHFQREDADGVSVHCTPADPLLILRGWIEDGIDTCGDIAAEMGLSKGTVSKLAKRGVKAGWLTIDNRRYVLTTPTILA